MMIFLVYVYYYTIKVFSWSRKKYVEERSISI